MDFHVTYQEASEEKLILSKHSEKAFLQIVSEKAKEGYAFKENTDI